MNFVRCEQGVDDCRDFGIGRFQQVCGFHLDPGHDHRQGLVIWQPHAPTPRQIFLKSSFNRVAQINRGEGILGRPARTVQSAAQAGNDLVGKLRLGTTITECRKWCAHFRELLNRLLYLIEIWMRFYDHDAMGISAVSQRVLQ